MANKTTRAERERGKKCEKIIGDLYTNIFLRATLNPFYEKKTRAFLQHVVDFFLNIVVKKKNFVRNSGNFMSLNLNFKSRLIRILRFFYLFFL